MRKTLGIILMLMAVGIVLLMGGKIKQRAFKNKAAPASNLSFIVPTVPLDVGKTFPIAVNIEPNSINQITAVELYVSFDPKILKLESIIPSQIFSQTLSNPSIDNTSGQASIVVALPLQNTNNTQIIFPVGGYPENSVPPFLTSNPPYSAPTNSSPVVILNFTGISEGATTVKFLPETQAAAIGEPGNVLTSLNSATLTIGAPTTPTTGSLSCACQTTLDKCSDCNFNQYSDITYGTPLSCSQSSNIFFPDSQPTQTNKDSWCQRAERTRGDTNGDNIINTTDYFYYVATVNGGKIPSSVNPDANGDGETGFLDRTIIVRTLSQ